ncbi:MAG: hypothetical protein CVU43_17130 [Chloroflexi bacterium HGW-Chloroflexi-5]|nr:MAG: hypothetical protein CVU43_17130 [Chloroflexi bacterium HGW-Chloroflexi-5]
MFYNFIITTEMGFVLLGFWLKMAKNGLKTGIKHLIIPKQQKNSRIIVKIFINNHIKSHFLVKKGLK